MNTMDLKGISWVGNIYLEFESTCLELEETMYQETAKYVENQVQTVGTSVKKFYSDVMQDLLPPSSTDLVKVAAADLSLNPYADVGIHKKPKASITEDTVNNLLIGDLKVIAGDRTSSFSELFNVNHVPPSYPGGSAKGPYSEFYSGKNKDGEIYGCSKVCIKGISKKDKYPLSEKSSSNNPMSEDWSRASSARDMSEKHEAARDQIGMILPGASVEVIGCDSREEVEEGKTCNDIMVSNESVDYSLNDSPVSDSILSVESSGKKGRKLRFVSSTGRLPGEAIGTCSHGALVSQISSYTSGDTQYSQSAGEVIFTSRTERSGEYNTDVIENNGTTEPRMEPIEEDDTLELEETCVLVDGEKLFVVSHGESKHRSYKKKIREAFALKMKSARKQEYERLATQYGDADKRSNIKSEESVMPSLTTDLNTENLPTLCFSESEWELL